MRICISLFFICFFAFAQTPLELVKGQTLFLEFEKKDFIEVKNGDKKLNVFPHPNNDKKLVSLFSLPYKNPPKKSTITIVHTNKKENFMIYTQEGNYTSETIQVQVEKVFPPKTAQERITQEAQETSALYKNYTQKALFNGTFQLPLESKITSAYGKARVFNNSITSYHSGIDFRAKIGTAIKAANSGVVVLAKERYYAGGSIVIDHGYGIYSQYYHLSKLNVKVGQQVHKGQIIGLSGASGRASGPHLHFGIIVALKQVDPLDFIAKFNLLFNEI
ncbi:M23 family metallopeptidase [Campylobacter sp. MIT 21-1685]|uniref:M23 family metallopeptidase n=1 Tax=unclassified Campylobacter TaxID=2593542 RepID=UPI00224B4378|nr:MULTISPECIES: M23 family metallopeptidase [unclassified Campylobacter]MCX2682485.1 M23 family metallopeptidase [Campylobacter sp. MIT 21-1684]MCX2750802.1 M23 family metallopeptidase [Campylobacter sp. MIT 21-1682]MCX2806966.1 M23 family metallopeptidase [Campylobacter sp. MIT 21-1685]